MKIKDGYIIKKVMGSYLIVSVTDPNADSCRMQTTNEVGKFLFDLLAENTTAEHLAEKLVGEYDVNYSRALKDVTAFTQSLKAAGILED